MIVITIYIFLFISNDFLLQSYSAETKLLGLVLCGFGNVYKRVTSHPQEGPRLYQPMTSLLGGSTRKRDYFMVADGTYTTRYYMAYLSKETRQYYRYCTRPKYIIQTYSLNLPMKRPFYRQQWWKSIDLCSFIMHKICFYVAQ